MSGYNTLPRSNPPFKLRPPAWVLFVTCSCPHLAWPCPPLQCFSDPIHQGGDLLFLQGGYDLSPGRKVEILS